MTYGASHRSGRYVSMLHGAARQREKPQAKTTADGRTPTGASNHAEKKQIDREGGRACQRVRACMCRAMRTHLSQGARLGLGLDGNWGGGSCERERGGSERGEQVQTAACRGSGRGRGRGSGTHSMGMGGNPAQRECLLAMRAGCRCRCCSSQTKASACGVVFGCGGTDAAMPFLLPRHCVPSPKASCKSATTCLSLGSAHISKILIRSTQKKKKKRKRF